MKRILAAAVLAAALAGAGTAHVSAHAAFVSSSPAPDSTVTSPPAQVSIIYSGPISRTSTITVTGPSGAAVSGAAEVNGNRATATVRADGPGIYRVAWTNTSLDDGHQESGAFQFTVAAPSPAPTTAAAPSPAAPAPTGTGAAPVATAPRPATPAPVAPAPAPRVPAAGAGTPVDGGSLVAGLALAAGVAGGLALARRRRSGP